MTEDKIKKYFLGKLSETENNDFEEQFATQESLFDQAQLIERELIDDYLQQRLSANERNLFETNYLTTPKRYEKVNFAQNLFENLKVNPQQINEKPTFWQTIFSSFQLSKAYAFGIIAILFISIFCIVWLNMPNTQNIAELNNSNKTPLPTNEIKTNSNQSNQTNINSDAEKNVNAEQNKSIKEQNKPKQSTTPKTTPTPKTIEPPKPTFASFTLLPGSMRSNGEQSIKIDPTLKTVNLTLSLPKDAPKYQTFQTTIKTADGETVFTTSNQTSLVIKIPTAKLSNKTYIIFLEGKTNETPAESISEYTFRVIQKK